MKRKLLYPFLIIISALLLVIAYCKKEAVVPAVTTNKYVHDITDATATGGGTVTSDGGAEVTERGVCWSPTANPTISLTTRTFDGGGASYINAGVCWNKTPGPTFQ